MKPPRRPRYPQHDEPEIQAGGEEDPDFPEQEADFTPRHRLDDVELRELFAWTEQEFLDNTEGSPIRRIGYECWLRNIAVALGNATASDAIVLALKQRLTHPSPLVREHVAWALAQPIYIPVVGLMGLQNRFTWKT